MSMSPLCSRRETVSWPTPREEASSTCVRFTACRRSFRVASSSARRSIFSRLFRGSFARTSSRFFVMACPLFSLTALLEAHRRQVRVEPLIGNRDELSVEPSLIDPGLVAAREEDGASFRGECERHPPGFSPPVETEFLHVRVPRSLKRIHGRPPQYRAIVPQQDRVGEEFVLQFLVK